MFERDTVEGYDPDKLCQQWKEMEKAKKTNRQVQFNSLADPARDYFEQRKYPTQKNLKSLSRC